MKTSDFDFDLPAERIARTPLAERDASRLLLLPFGSGPVQHLRFGDLPSLLARGDLLVLNDTRVIPARLRGSKEGTGGQVELLLCEPLPPTGARAAWRCLGQAGKPLRPGSALRFGELRAEVLAVLGEGFLDVAFDADESAVLGELERSGEVPLPPYLGREAGPEDRERYQTLFARVPGAVAAPTAGLHFTKAVFAALAERGVRTAMLTLHVGPGTFLPVRADEIEEHRLHPERFDISLECAAAVAETRATGARVVAVGTTSVRALETAAAPGRTVRSGPGTTELFVRPGYEPKVVDGLLTNFHLPRSTLLMLVAALTGRERLLATYAEAVRLGYRFYSYGDAMLVL